LARFPRPSPWSVAMAGDRPSSAGRGSPAQAGPAEERPANRSRMGARTVWKPASAPIAVMAVAWVSVGCLADDPGDPGNPEATGGVEISSKAEIAGAPDGGLGDPGHPDREGMGRLRRLNPPRPARRSSGQRPRPDPRRR
jgi:hypothetical protein